MPFKYQRTLFLKESDATGVLYFPEQFTLFAEAFQTLLFEKGMALEESLPVVHAEGDYLSPLKVGDEVVVFLNVSHIGTSSFTLSFCIKKGEKKVGEGKVVHVVTRGGSAVPIPDSIRKILSPFLES